MPKNDENPYRGHRYRASDESFYRSRPSTTSRDVMVAFAPDGALAISYFQDGKKLEWYGRENGQGHWEIQGPEPHDKGTLHQYAPAARFLEGYCGDAGEAVMWRVALPDPKDFEA